jgi:hypothetical protein
VHVTAAVSFHRAASRGNYVEIKSPTPMDEHATQVKTQSYVVPPMLIRPKGIWAEKVDTVYTWIDVCGTGAPNDRRTIERHQMNPAQAAASPVGMVGFSGEAREVALDWLPRLVDSASKDRNRMRRVLLKRSEPRAIADVAISEHRRTAREGFLLAAISLLDELGPRSWPVLRAMASAGTDECELFIGLIADCEGVSERERAGALTDLARRGNVCTKLAIFERVPLFSTVMKRAILRVLAKDEAEEIRDEALDYLSSLGD